MKLLSYVLLLSWLFALLDWKTVHVTRWTHPEWKDWMHANERRYANVTSIIEPVLCMPCMALKPIFYAALMGVEASQEEQDAITHAPEPTRFGFYHLVDRQTSHTFVSWLAWFGYWLVPSLIWWRFSKRFFIGD